MEKRVASITSLGSYSDYYKDPFLQSLLPRGADMVALEACAINFTACEGQANQSDSHPSL